jgi:hypothetical protein
MRPCSVYANPTCPASDAGDVLALLRGHRVGLRLVMILLSQQRWTPTAIAELLGCDAATVRRWIHRYNTHGPSGLADQPRRGRLRLGSPHLGARIRRLLDHPRAWTIGRLWLALGQPAISLRTLRGGSARLRRGADPRLVAPGDPDRDQTLAALRQAISDLPQGTVVLAQDETHINLLPWVRATWIARGRRTQVITPGKNHRRTIFGAVELATGRWCYQICRKAVSATFTAFCEQLLATWPTAPLVAVVCDNTIIHRSKIVQRWLAAHPRILARRPLQPPGQPCRAHLGCAQGLAGQHSHPDHPRSRPPSPCLLPRPQPHPDPDHRRPAQLTLAPGGVTCRTSGRPLRSLPATPASGPATSSGQWPRRAEPIGRTPPGR